jgi:hypothetical protein
MAKKPSKQKSASAGAAKKRASKAGSGTSADKAAVEAVLADQMPGWELCGVEPAEIADAMREAETMDADKMPSVKDLRRKFFGEDAADAKDSPDFRAVDEAVKTVRIRPTKGGAAKTADVRNGKITIVQG